MTFTFLKIIGIGFILSVSTLANATLIDNGDYTTDTESGLDWLDWTLTINKTQTEALTQFSGAGWRAATGDELADLLENFFVCQSSCTSTFIHNTSFNGYADKYKKFSELFTNRIGYSYVTLEGLGFVGVDDTWIFNGYLPTTYSSANYSSGSTGIPLVKPATAVTEPAIITLFALGFVGIGFARRRQS
jgi:hypothetical protein